MAERNLEVNIIARDRASRPIKNIQSTIIRFVGAVSAALAGLRAAVFPINQAREFERALADVAKTTGFVDEEITQLSADLVALSRTVDTSANDLAKIAAAAGQLGLGEAGGAAIVQFTESIARAATTLDLTAEDAATAFAKIGSIFNVPIENTERLIATVNELSNTTTATADQLIDVIKRTGTITGTFEESAALAAQAIQKGVSPEVAGTSLVKIFSNFESKADQFASQFGISVGDFLGKGVIERWEFYLGELSKLSEEESSRVINKLSGSGRIFALVTKQLEDFRQGLPIFNSALRNSTTAFDEGTSAINEYERISQTLNVQLDILGNNFRALAIELGQAALPALTGIVRRLQEFLQSDEVTFFFQSLAEGLNTAIDVLDRFITGFVEAFSGELVNTFTVAFTAAIGALAIGITRLVAGVLRLLTAITGIRRASSLAGNAFQFLQQQAVRFGLAARQSAVAGNELSGVYANIAAGAEAASAATLQYANATQTATRSLAGLQAAGARGLAARGAGGASAIATGGQAQAQLRLLERQQRLEQQNIRAGREQLRIAQARVRAAQERIAVINKIDLAQGRSAEIGRIGLARAQAEIRTQQQLVVQVQQRLAQDNAVNAALTTRIGILGRVAAARTAENLGAIGQAGRGVVPIFTRIAITGRRLIGVLGPLGVAIRGVGTAVRFLFGAIGGLPGLILTGLIFFLDDAIELFNKLTGAVNESSAAVTTALRNAASETEAVANQQVAAFKRVQADLARGGEVEQRNIFLTGEETPGELNKFLRDASTNVRLYTEAVRGAEVEVERLKQQNNELIERQVDLEYEIEGADETEQDISALTIALKQNLEQQEANDAKLKETRTTLGELRVGIDATKESLSQLFTPGTIKATLALNELRRVEDGVDELQKRFDALQKLDLVVQTDVEVSDEAKRKILTDLAVLFGDTGEIDFSQPFEEIIRQASFIRVNLPEAIAAGTAEAEKLGQVFDDIVNVFNDRDVKRFQEFGILNASARQVSAVAQVARTVKDTTKLYNDQEQQIVDNKEAVISNFLAQQRITEELKEQESAYEKNRKAAQGIFDNSTKEARAFAKQLANVNKSIDDILDTRRRTQRLNRVIERTESDIQSRTQRIAELEKFLAEADKKRLFFQEARERSAAREELIELKKANLQDQAIRRDAERRRAQQRLNQLQEQIPDLFRQAQAAAEEGNIAAFTALKSQIDSAVGEGGDIIGDLAELQDAEGNFLFRDGEIKSFQDALSASAQPFQAAIPELNKTLLEASKEAEKAVAEQIKEAGKVLKETADQFKILASLIPGLANAAGEVNEKIVEAWKTANEPFNEAVDQFGNIISNSVLSGQGLSDLSGNIKALSEAAERVAQAATGTIGPAVLGAQAEALAGRPEQGATAKARTDAAKGTAVAASQEAVKKTVEDASAVIDKGQEERAKREAAAAAAAAEEAGPGIGRRILQGFIDFVRGGGGAGGLANILGAEIGRGFLASVQEFLKNSRFGTLQAPGAASGGFITGPGTGTSDSILARLSNGEYVMDAKTTAALGPSFFAMLQRITGGRSSSLSRFRGGLPAFAGGGFAAAGNSNYRPVNINIPGVGSYPMLAQENVVAEVARVVSRETLKRGTKGNLR